MYLDVSRADQSLGFGGRRLPVDPRIEHTPRFAGVPDGYDVDPALLPGSPKPDGVVEKIMHEFDDLIYRRILAEVLTQLTFLSESDLNYNDIRNTTRARIASNSQFYIDAYRSGNMMLISEILTKTLTNRIIRKYRVIKNMKMKTHFQRSAIEKLDFGDAEDNYFRKGGVVAEFPFKMDLKP